MPRGLYVHVPFCVHKCHYCDFYSLVDTRDRQAAFTARLIAEIRASTRWLTRPLETIFVGGGTPTLLADGHWTDLLAALRACVPLGSAPEFTVEANPETVTSSLLDVLAAGGVNRLSIGAQSFHPQRLETLERRHDPANVRRSVRLARSAGIDDVNIDLIFGIPGETLDEWRADLEAALALDPSHLSCYGLMYEPGTPLAAKLRAGRIRRVGQDLEAAMYESAMDTLQRAGFEHYEISNWARPGRRCRHNLLYWSNASWWPLGPSASGHVGGVRWKNIARLADYLEVGSLPPVVDVERLDDDGRVGEMLMLGLRLIDGIEQEHVDDLLASGHRGHDRDAAVRRHLASGLLERCDGRLKLTRHGLLLADTVLADLI